MNIFHNSIILIAEQLEQYVVLTIKIGSLLDHERDNKLRDFYLEQLRNVYNDYKEVTKRLVTLLELYFDYEKKNGLQMNLNYRKLYKELIKH